MLINRPSIEQSINQTFSRLSLSLSATRRSSPQPLPPCTHTHTHIQAAINTRTNHHSLITPRDHEGSSILPHHVTRSLSYPVADSFRPRSDVIAPGSSEFSPICIAIIKRHQSRMHRAVAMKVSKYKHHGIDGASFSSEQLRRRLPHGSDVSSVLESR